VVVRYSQLGVCLGFTGLLGRFDLVDKGELDVEVGEHGYGRVADDELCAADLPVAVEDRFAA
jgi:hypothetical protein